MNRIHSAKPKPFGTSAGPAVFVVEAEPVEAVHHPYRSGSGKYGYQNIRSITSGRDLKRDYADRWSCLFADFPKWEM